MLSNDIMISLEVEVTYALVWVALFNGRNLDEVLAWTVLTWGIISVTFDKFKLHSGT